MEHTIFAAFEDTHQADAAMAQAPETLRQAIQHAGDEEVCPRQGVVAGVTSGAAVDAALGAPLGALGALIAKS